MGKNYILIIITAFILVGLYFSSGKTAEIQTGENALPPQAGLPAKVEAKRQAIYEAALSRDYDKLVKEAGPQLEYSFGGPVENGFKPFLMLSEQHEKKSAFDIIPTLLKLKYGKESDIYVWPKVFVKTAKEWTEEDIKEMEKILTPQEIERYKEFGSYAYYRLGINKDGTWVYYLAGD